MPELITFDALLDRPVETTTEDAVLRTGKIFHVGDFADKGFSLTEAEADAAIAAFTPVPADYEHVPGPLDGQLGMLRRVWRQGTDLLGEAAVPRWLDPLLSPNNHKLSLAWDRATKQIVGWGWVRYPRISDAALYAAFAGARHSSSDQAALQAAHDHIVQAGAMCPAQPKEARMSLWDTVRAALERTPADFSEEPSPNLATVTPTERETALQAELDAQKAVFAAQQTAAAEAASAARQAAAVTFADRLVTDRVILPALRPVALAAYAQALADDAAHSASVTFSDAAGTESTGSRAEVLAALFAGLGATVAPLTTEHIPAGTVVLSATGASDADKAALAADRINKLMKLTPLGQNALRNGKES